MENQILGPAIRKGLEHGRKLGWEEGFLIGLREGRAIARRQLLLEELLKERFGEIPPWAESKIAAATPETLTIWCRRLLGAESLENFLA